MTWAVEIFRGLIALIGDALRGTSRKKVEDLIKKIEELESTPLPVRYIELEDLKVDPEYIKVIAEMAVKPQVRHLLYKIQDAMVHELETCGPDNDALRAQLAGELKAMQIIRVTLEDYISKAKELS
jgi:hypothetical protein